jgi:hypothetical protein
MTVNSMNDFNVGYLVWLVNRGRDAGGNLVFSVSGLMAACRLHHDGVYQVDLVTVHNHS